MAASSPASSSGSARNDQSIVSRRVRWRASVSGPPASNRSSARSSRAWRSPIVERADPARRQLEGERQPVETAGDVGDEGRVAPGRGPGRARAGGRGPGTRRRAARRRPPAAPSSGTGSGPMRTRCSAARPRGRREVASRVRSGQASTSAPARSPHRGPARARSCRARAAASSVVERVARRGHDLVVADPGSEPERGGARPRADAALVGDRRELDQHDGASGVGEVGGGLERQPGLADAAGPDDA